VSVARGTTSASLSVDIAVRKIGNTREDDKAA
jgi:hypothetical protein